MGRGPLDFDLGGISNSIKMIEGERDGIMEAHTKLQNCIDNTLRPNWTTTSGEQMVKKVQDFSTETIQNNLIPYVNNKIQGLRNAYQKMVEIDNA